MVEWVNFTNSIETEMPRIFQMLKAQDPIIEDDFTIKLVLNNQSQERVLMEKAYNKLMVHLKSKLNNGAIQLKIEIGATESKTNMVYTTSDKFKYLADMNDKLNTLKQKFGLDFE